MKTIEQQIEEAFENADGANEYSYFKSGVTFGRELGKREGFEFAIEYVRQHLPVGWHVDLKQEGQRLGILSIETKE